MKTALIIVDAQNDFCEGGSLAVPRSYEIFPHINTLRKSFPFYLTVLTKDWHPKNHFSFAENHGLSPFVEKQIKGVKQMMWPTHCVQNSFGAEINEYLDTKKTDIIVLKGLKQDQETYSGFGTSENPTELKEILKTNGITRVYVVGLAFDYCVGSTARDAKMAGFETYVVKECTKSVSSVTASLMENTLTDLGISYITIEEALKDKHFSTSH